MITIEQAKATIDTARDENIKSDYGFLVKYFNDIFTSICKESGAKYYDGYLVICYKSLNGHKSFEKFLALCKLLKMPLKPSEFETFEYRGYTWYILGGWCDKNSINREVARFLLKCAYYGDFKSIRHFCDSHYLKTHYSIRNHDKFHTTFANFFSNLRGNLHFNRNLGSQGLIWHINNNSLRIKPKAKTI